MPEKIVQLNKEVIKGQIEVGLIVSKPYGANTASTTNCHSSFPQFQVPLL